MRTVPISYLVGILVAFVLLGIAFLVGGPTMMQGFDAMVNATNASQFTAFQTIAKFGPALIVLGIIIAIAFVGFMGIKLSSQKKGE